MDGLVTSMEYTSTIDFESKLIPGVSFKLKKISHGRRIELNQKTAEAFAKIAEIQRELTPVQEDIDRAEAAAKLEPCSCTHPIDAGAKDCHNDKTLRCTVAGCACREPKPDAEIGSYPKKYELEGKIYESVVTDLYPIYSKWGVVSIDGLVLDGAPATMDSILSIGPEGLVPELGEEVQRILKLTPEETLGFKLPTTLGGQVDGQIQTSSAPPVNGESCTKAVGAAATFQS